MHQRLRHRTLTPPLFVPPLSHISRKTLLSLDHGIPSCPTDTQLIIAAYLSESSLILPVDTAIILNLGKSIGYLQNIGNKVAEWVTV